MRRLLDGAKGPIRLPLLLSLLSRAMWHCSLMKWDLSRVRAVTSTKCIVQGSGSRARAIRRSAVLRIPAVWSCIVSLRQAVSCPLPGIAVTCFRQTRLAPTSSDLFLPSIP